MTTLSKILTFGSAVAVAIGFAQCGNTTMNDPMPMDMTMPPAQDMAMSFPPPVLTAVTPALGSTAGGIPLTLTGQNFQMMVSVTVAGVPSSSAAPTSSNSITATLPPKPGALGKVPVVVKNGDGQMVTRSDLFAYYAGQIIFPGKTIPTGSTPESVVVSDA